MAKGMKTGGRVKGSRNITTRTAMEAIAFAADSLGGAERLVEWAKEDQANEKVFWGTIYPKLLPLQISNPDGEEFKTVTRIENVIVDPANPDA